MKITFVGADHEVTGSCHYLEAAGKKILIDCGMEQGRDDFENIPIPANPGDIDYVFLTHAHIDHSGNLPLLSAQGFKGHIYATQATCDLCDIMLLDSAHIQEFEAEWRNRKGQRADKPAYEPPYTVQDATNVLQRFIPCSYNTYVNVCDGIRIRFTDVGHLLGSSFIEVCVTENGEETKIVFSGDVGNINQPILKDPAPLDEADYLLIESTYGDRSHGPRVDYAAELAKVIQRTFERGGNVVVPSFAVGRTQEILYFIRQIKQQHLINGFDDFEVYVDSPLAVRATTIYNDHNLDCFDDEARELICKGINPIAFHGLKLAITSDESRAINVDTKPKVIISASGMCEAGRIKHHLKHNLWRPDSTILFVGYQAVGTLGRALVDGAGEVKLFGENIVVKAEVLSLPGISGHADREGLIRWGATLKNKPKKVFVVHGDDEVVEPFAHLLTEELGWDTMAPYSGTVYDLTANECVFEAEPHPTAKKTEADRKTEGGMRADALFTRLLNAAEKLLAIVRRSEGYANKDLKKMVKDIEAFNEKWE